MLCGLYNPLDHEQSAGYSSDRSRCLFTGGGGADVAPVSGVGPRQHLVTQLALTLLHRFVKRGSSGSGIVRTPEALALLEPLIPLVTSALRSGDDDVTSLALRCLALMVGLPLPGAPVVIYDLASTLCNLQCLKAKKRSCF